MMMMVGYLFLDGMVCPMDFKSSRINFNYFDWLKVLPAANQHYENVYCKLFSQSFISDKINTFWGMGNADTEGELFGQFSCLVAILKIVFRRYYFLEFCLIMRNEVHFTFSCRLTSLLKLCFSSFLFI